MESLIPTIIGFLMIVFRKWFARSTIDFQNTYFNGKYGEKDIKVSEYVIIFVGITMIFIGFL